jgi:hypothetical protein
MKLTTMTQVTIDGVMQGNGANCGSAHGSRSKPARSGGRPRERPADA